jgi:hypothetical protein
LQGAAVSEAVVLGAVAVGGILGLSWSVYADFYLPFFGVRRMALRLQPMTVVERDRVLRIWVRRRCLIPTVAWGVFIAAIALASLSAGAWESTWRQQLPWLLFWMASPLLVLGGSWVWFGYMAVALRKGSDSG